MSVCTTCGGRTPPEANADNLVDLARVRDLAEAGYLVDLLERRGVHARIRHDQSFDAVTGGWFFAHYVQCPAEDVEAAALAIGDEADAAEMEQRAEAQADDSPNVAAWRSVALALATGCFCFLLGQRLASPSDPAAGAQHDVRLGAALAALDRPLFTAPDRRGQAYRLSVDRDARRWRLDADLNADGEFEARVLGGALMAAGR